MRAINAPAIFMAINFIITDWILLSKHSIVFCIVVALVMLGRTDKQISWLFTTKEGLQHVLKFMALLCAVHFTHWILCYTH